MYPTKNFFPDATKEIKLSNEVKEVFSLFFQNFDYEILSVNVDNDKKEATASLRLSTIDAPLLPKIRRSFSENDNSQSG